MRWHSSHTQIRCSILRQSIGEVYVHWNRNGDDDLFARLPPPNERKNEQFALRWNVDRSTHSSVRFKQNFGSSLLWKPLDAWSLQIAWRWRRQNWCWKTNEKLLIFVDFSRKNYGLYFCISTSNEFEGCDFMHKYNKPIFCWLFFCSFQFFVVCNVESCQLYCVQAYIIQSQNRIQCFNVAGAARLKGIAAYTFRLTS